MHDARRPAGHALFGVQAVGVEAHDLARLHVAHVRAPPRCRARTSRRTPPSRGRRAARRCTAAGCRSGRGTRRASRGWPAPWRRRPSMVLHRRGGCPRAGDGLSCVTWPMSLRCRLAVGARARSCTPSPASRARKAVRVHERAVVRERDQHVVDGRDVRLGGLPRRRAAARGVARVAHGHEALERRQRGFVEHLRDQAQILRRHHRSRHRPRRCPRFPGRGAAAPAGRSTSCGPRPRQERTRRTRRIPLPGGRDAPRAGRTCSCDFSCARRLSASAASGSQPLPHPRILPGAYSSTEQNSTKRLPSLRSGGRTWRTRTGCAKRPRRPAHPSSGPPPPLRSTLSCTYAAQLPAPSANAVCAKRVVGRRRGPERERQSGVKLPLRREHIGRAMAVELVRARRPCPAMAANMEPFDQVVPVHDVVRVREVGPRSPPDRNTAPYVGRPPAALAGRRSRRSGTFSSSPECTMG